jgi:signal transduction histidine kinase
VVLAAGLVSAAALAGAASLTYGDESQAGAAALARAAGEVVVAVETASDRALASPPGELSRLPLPSADAEPWRAAEPAPPASGAVAAFDALFAEAGAWRRAGEGGQALELALEAAGKDVDPARRGQAWLLAIQLAVASGDHDLARAQWEATVGVEGLAGHEVAASTSLALLCDLAAREALAPEQVLHSARARLDDWLAGRLALPGAAPTLVPDERGDELVLAVDPSRSALWKRLVEVLPEDEAALWEARRRSAELGAALADEPGSWPLESLGRGLPLAPLQDGFVWWAGSAPPTEVALVTDRRLHDLLDRALKSAGLPPQGFMVPFGRYDAFLDARAEVVVERTWLLEHELGFTVLHEHPPNFVTAARSRQRWARAGLLLAALFAAGASVATFRSLRREARLGHLRTAFVAGVSHELRTPVASIQLLAENLEAGRITDEQDRARYVVLIRREARRLGRLVNDVLDFARLDRGEPARLTVECLDTEVWAEELADDAVQLATRLGAELEVRVADVPAEMEMDGDALRRAVLNLVDNAARHGRPAPAATSTAAATGPERSREAPPVVTLELEIQDGALVARVRDRGRGVPARRRRHVLQPFVTGGAGSGLGLSLVAAIAEGHGGGLRLLDPDDGGPGLVAELSVPIPREAPRPRIIVDLEEGTS